MQDIYDFFLPLFLNKHERSGFWADAYMATWNFCKKTIPGAHRVSRTQVYNIQGSHLLGGIWRSTALCVIIFNFTTKYYSLCPEKNAILAFHQVYTNHLKFDQVYTKGINIYDTKLVLLDPSWIYLFGVIYTCYLFDKFCQTLDFFY